jgi:predicted nucleic acid-binding protein
MWTRSSIKIPRRVADPRGRGLLDTSVVVELERVRRASLPAEFAISAVTLAELAAGPHATRDSEERARRQLRLQWAEAQGEPVPIDTQVARAYGRIFERLAARGRKVRGRRGFDLFIAATALALGLPLYTRNAADFAGLDELIDIVPV